MSARLRPIPIRALLWFGVLGAPFAWAAQHVAGYALSEAACSVAAQRHGIALDAWTIVVTAVAAALAALAEVSAVAVFRATRDAGDEPPASRIRFLSIIGIAISPLFLAIILMSGLGSVFLANCQQS